MPPSQFRSLQSVQVSDLLVILIVSIGSARLAGPLLVGLVSGDSSPQSLTPGQTLLATVLLLFVQSLILVGIVWRMTIRKYGLRWADLGMVPSSAPWVRRAILIGLLCLPLVALVNQFVQSLLQEPFVNPQIGILAPAGFNWIAFLSILAMSSIVVPIAEEIAFRGLLFPWLRDRYGLMPALVGSAVCFAALHGILQLVPAIAVLGIVLALVFQKSGSLWPAIIVHGVFNGAMTSLLYMALDAGVTPS